MAVLYSPAMSPWIQLSNTCTVKLLILALLLSAESFGQQHSTKSEITSYKAVVNLNLPRQEGRVPLYYSACCQKHAVEIQKAFEDMVSFYQEKLDIDTNVAVAVLDENDWDHVAQQMKDQGFAPYGMTNVSHAPSGVIAFIPADDEGVITKSQLADGRYASTATLKTFASAHLTYDEAARRFILHPAFHEVGHYLTHSYAMDLPDHWLDEMVASYWAYAYEKTRNPQIATIVEGFTEMSSPPFALASLDEFENAFAKKEGIPSATTSGTNGNSNVA